MDALDHCKISDDKGINAIILAKRVKGFFVLFDLMGVEAVEPCGKRDQLFEGGEVIGDIDTVKASGFQANDDGLVLIRKSWSKLRAEMTLVWEPMSIPTKSVDR